MRANNFQVGGTHYNEMDYQPWDFITDYDISYIVGLAIKYICRHRDKNGIEDLKKAIHCLEKAIECNLYDIIIGNSHIDSFCEQLNYEDALAIKRICNNEFESAIVCLKLIAMRYD